MIEKGFADCTGTKRAIQRVLKQQTDPSQAKEKMLRIAEKGSCKRINKQISAFVLLEEANCQVTIVICMPLSVHHRQLSIHWRALDNELNPILADSIGHTKSPPAE